MYLRYGIPYRLQRSLKTAVRAMKVTTTVFWDTDRVVLVCMVCACVSGICRLRQ